MLNKRGLLGSLVALVTACGDSGGGSTGTGASTTGMTGTDAGPTEGTAATTGTDTGETGEGTTADSEQPTSGTTGPVSDPEILQACLDRYAADEASLNAYCACPVTAELYDSFEECLADNATPGGDVACVCEQYAQFPAMKPRLECELAALETMTACYTSDMCGGGVGQVLMCTTAYEKALEACAPAVIAAEAAAVIECEMKAPFMCGSGETIPEDWRCNTRVECMDQSDESTCPDTFMCKDGSGWFPNVYKCDNQIDCADGEDEDDCPTFMCMDGEVILGSKKCDGLPDCADGSDEVGCP
jgi:hypothetical protein